MSPYDQQWRTLDDVRSLYLQAKDRIATIYQEVLDEVLGDADLSTLNSASKTAIWRLWAFVCAFQNWLHELLWIRYKDTLNAAAAAAQSHSAPWYKSRALEYQHGDEIEVVNGVVRYPEINLANRIIAVASVVEVPSDGSVIMKVARIDSGNLAPLTTGQLDGFRGYINAVRDAGVRMTIVSQNADVLRLEAVVYYDPSRQSIDAFQPAFEAAVVDYLRNKIGFDGKFRRLKLVDRLQELSGFVDIDINVLQASIAYVSSPNWVDIDLTYTAVAGYIEVDENYPLDVTITYQANV